MGVVMEARIQIRVKNRERIYFLMFFVMMVN